MAKRMRLAVHGPQHQAESLDGLKISVIGAGKMGQALLKGLVACGVPPRLLTAAETDGAIRREVKRRFHCAVTAQVLDVARDSDVILLAVKPQQVPEVVSALAAHLPPRRPLVISIAAGIRLRWLEARLPGVPVVRVMPNLPATVGCGFTAVAPGRAASRRHQAVALALFQAVGEAMVLPERHFDAITAVSGSGPAYVFFLAQAWARAAAALGLPAAVADQAIRRTLEGSLRLWVASGESPATLIANVASKKGTTEAALTVLAAHRVEAHFMEALRAAARRSKALAWS